MDRILFSFSSFIQLYFHSTYQIPLLCWCLSHRHTNKHILQYMYSTVSWIRFMFLSSLLLKRLSTVRSWITGLSFSYCAIISLRLYSQYHSFYSLLHNSDSLLLDLHYTRKSTFKDYLRGSAEDKIGCNLFILLYLLPLIDHQCFRLPNYRSSLVSLVSSC